MDVGRYDTAGLFEAWEGEILAKNTCNVQDKLMLSLLLTFKSMEA